MHHAIVVAPSTANVLGVSQHDRGMRGMWVFWQGDVFVT
jgi:hypothetical protein